MSSSILSSLKSLVVRNLPQLEKKNLSLNSLLFSIFSKFTKLMSSLRFVWSVAYLKCYQLFCKSVKHFNIQNQITVFKPFCVDFKYPKENPLASNMSMLSCNHEDNWYTRKPNLTFHSVHSPIHLLDYLFICLLITFPSPPPKKKKKEEEKKKRKEKNHWY